jgi:hypothetical protein
MDMVSDSTKHFHKGFKDSSENYIAYLDSSLLREGFERCESDCQIPTGWKKIRCFYYFKEEYGRISTGYHFQVVFETIEAKEVWAEKPNWDKNVRILDEDEDPKGDYTGELGYYLVPDKYTLKARIQTLRKQNDVIIPRIE